MSDPSIRLVPPAGRDQQRLAERAARRLLERASDLAVAELEAHPVRVSGGLIREPAAVEVDLLQAEVGRLGAELGGLLEEVRELRARVVDLEHRADSASIDVAAHGDLAGRVRDLEERGE